jgi:hypothetical protein
VHRRRFVIPAILLGVLASSACASGGSGSTSGGSASTSTASGTRRSASVIVPQDLLEGNFSNAFEAIEALRPNWLRPQDVRDHSGGGAQPFVGVVMAGNRSDLGASFLRTLTPDSFKEIRRLNASQAQNRYGVVYQWGVLEIIGR